MTQTHKKQTDKNTLGTVLIGVTEAAAIAGVAVAATMAMEDKNTRKKVKKMLIKAKDKAIDYVEATEPSLD